MMALTRLVGSGLLVGCCVFAGCAAPTPEVIGAPRITPTAPETPAATWPARTRYRTVDVLGRRIFYRQAGDTQAPTVLLLHGYPSSSHTYRALIPLLSGRFHVIAPDNLGSGFSAHPSPSDLTYTFDLLAQHIAEFTEALGIDRYVIYMQDFGAPVGFRLALGHPERVAGLVVQNANAYLDGLTPPRREFFRRAHEDRSDEHVQSLAQWVSDEAISNGQYLRDVPGDRAEFMSPDAWTHDIAMLRTKEDRDIQVQLFQDYQTNIDRYPDWQNYLRTSRPPTLVLWGERDPAFISAGAQAYLRDLPEAELHLIDAGHFAAEERPAEIAQLVTRFVQDLSAE